MYLKSCAYFNDGGQAYTPYGNGSFVLADRCSQGTSLQIDTDYPKQGESGEWITIPPSSISITSAYTPYNQVLIDPYVSSDGYQATFFWNGGSQTITPSGSCCGGMDYGVGINRQLGPSSYFGFKATCVSSGGCNGPLNVLAVRGIDLGASDDTPPVVTGDAGANLWSESGRWVRGAWPLAFHATADVGVCSMSAQVGGLSFAGPTDLAPNQHSWTQCPTPQSMSVVVDTTKLSAGPNTVQLQASDAAAPANVANPSETVNVDNTPVTLSMSGPTDAPTTAGTQYVIATAAAGPSGVAGINCSVDGGTYAWTAGSTAQVPVSGLGRHTVSCYAQNDAVDPTGADAVSPMQTWNLSIRQPALATAALVSVVNHLSCHRRRERVVIPAQWVNGQADGKPVRVRIPAENRRITITRCRHRIIVRRVRVGGRWRVIRTVVMPHLVASRRERVAYGAGFRVAGSIALSGGGALGGQPVEILTAPDNGQLRFTEAAATTSAPDGSWLATLPPGPSRLVEAVYGGSGSVEPAMSPTLSVTVPARISLTLHPRRTRWGSTIVIRGRLAGGYVPPSGELVVLRIGWRGGSAEIGHVLTRRDGRFSVRYTFLRGVGTETYEVWAASTPESDYPYAPGSSRKIGITVTS